MRSVRGQASVELVGAVPALMLLALVAFQLLAVGYSSVLAGDAAEAGALARAASWLVEPPADEAAHPGAEPTVGSFTARSRKKAERGTELRLVPPRPIERPLIAVVGLAPGCGATTLARALAAILARRDHSGTAIVASSQTQVGSSLSTRAAARLAARVDAHAVGRLCLARAEDADSLPRVAPVVLDLPRDRTAAASKAGLTILIAPGESEPALAELAARTLKAVTVVTQNDDRPRWDGRAFLMLPHSRLGARLAAAGWEPFGALRAAVEHLSDACEEAACA